MDFGELLKDKKTWVVAGGAAVVGLVVFLKRGSSTAAQTPAANSTASGVPVTGYLGGANTTSTDIASYLSQVSQQNQDQFNQWGQNLSDTLKAIQAAGTSATGNPGGPVTTPTPVYANVLSGWHIDQWIQDIQAGKGPAGSSGLTWDQLVALNPGLSQDITWRPGTSQDPGTRNNVFNNGYKLRVA